MTHNSVVVGGVRARMTSLVTDEEWKILQQKIQVFQEHVKSFQREVEERLG